MFEEDVFRIQTDGRLWFPSLDIFQTRDEYCIENFEDIGFSAILCFNEKAMAFEEAMQVNATGLSFSWNFLVSYIPNTY